MNSTKFTKYPPPNKKELVDRHRKVAPVTLISGEVSFPKRAALSSGLAKKNAALSDQELAHLLRRTTFGVRKSDIENFRGLMINQILEKMLVSDNTPKPPINDYNYAPDGIEDPKVDFGESWVTTSYNNDYEGARVQSLKSWIVRNWVNQPASIHEKMILFWHNLLPTQTWDVFIPKASYQYFQMLRRNALGNFKTIIKELTLDPSMLVFLNGTFNNKEAPDENYARELQELFCIGKGKNAKFTEEDVQAAARVLTGWIVDVESIENEGVPRSYFFPPFHDISNKTFSSFYGNTIVEGKDGEAGAEELDDLLTMIFDNQETALYLCRRLYNFFVYTEIDEATEQNVIQPLATTLRANDYEIAPILTILFQSEHFFDESNIGAMIKSPADFLIGMWRSLEVSETLVKDIPRDDIYLNYRMGLNMIWTMAREGMELGDPPSVSGWPAYYQFPQFDKFWISTDTITNRALSSDGMLYWGFWIMSGLQLPTDLKIFLKHLDHPENPVEMLQESASILLGLPLSDEKLDELKTLLLTGQQTDAYWTNAWEQYLSDPDNEEFGTVVDNRLKAVFQNMMQLGEFQLM